MTGEEKNTNNYEEVLDKVNTNSRPSDLKITDMRFAEIDGAPKHCFLMKIFTNQGLVGYGELRDASSLTYGLMLKSRLLGENPCNIDKLFRRIKQFGGPSRQGGGVSGVEVALWDLAGKAYGVPVYQMLGGKFRDRIRMYCDTDVEGRHTGKDMGLALKKRMESGYTYLKMDLGIGNLFDEPGTLCAPLGFLEEMKKHSPSSMIHQKGSIDPKMMRKKAYDLFNLAHPFTGIHITNKGLDLLEGYLRDARAVVGYDIPLALDHFGHIGVEDCIRFARRIEDYCIAWIEDMVPWHMTDQLVRLSRATTVPVCTGEDIYLKEGFRPLFESRAVSVIHPDILSAGGILELKKIGDMAQEYGVSMAMHMAESPIACLASVHCAAATENFLALENHSTDTPWWDDIVEGPSKPIVNRGFIPVPEGPGLGIESLNEDVLKEHAAKGCIPQWKPTDEWNEEMSNDRWWS